MSTLEKLQKQADKQAQALGHTLRWRAAEYYKDSMFGECECGATALVMSDPKKARYAGRVELSDKQINGSALWLRHGK